MSGTSADFSKHGASYLISEENYDRFIAGHETIGRPDGQFCIPQNQMDDLISNYPNDPQEWEKQLGLNEGSLGDGDIKRVDVQEPANHNLRPPSADMSGANDKYLGTGKVPGGQDEAVMDPFPNPETHPEVGKISTLSPTQEQSTGGSRSLADDLNNKNLFSENKQGDYTYGQSQYGKSASGSLELNKGERNAYAQRTVGGYDRTARDDGGHLIGNRFGGESGHENLEAQDRSVNRGAYKQKENEWANSLENGDKVFVNTQSYRSNGSERPDAFMGYQVVEHPDGTREWDAFSYQNEDPAVQEAQNKEIEQMSDYPDPYHNAMDYPEDYNPADYDEEATNGQNNAQDQASTQDKAESQDKADTPEETKNIEEANAPEEAEETEDAQKSEEPEETENAQKSEEPSETQSQDQSQSQDDSQGQDQSQSQDDSQDQDQGQDQSQDQDQGQDQSQDNDYDYGYGY